MGGLVNLFYLVLFVALGFPVALGIELYLRASRRAVPSRGARRDLVDDFTGEFMPVPEDSAIARRMREPAQAALPQETADPA